MTSFRALSSLAVVVVAAVVGGCGDTEYVGYTQPPPPARPVGESCTVDADCTTGRCIAGVCADTGCQTDEDCRDDEICVILGNIGNCEPRADFECTGDTRPIFSISTTSVTFDQVAVGATGTQTVTVTNLGQCLLNIAAIGLSEGTNADFACSPCSVASRSVPPRRTLDITVTYTPTRPGEATGALELRSDDVTAGEGGLVSVDLFARYDGVPSLRVQPLQLAFGFVPYSAGGGGGGSRTETVTLTNVGSGNALLEVERLFLERDLVFRITAVRQGGIDIATAGIRPDNPLRIPPFSVDNPASTVEVDVTFTPSRNDDFADNLYVRPGGFADDLNGVIVPVTGTSLGPPAIEVTPLELTYGGPGNDALPVGAVDFRQVTVSNNGDSDLVINPAIGGGTSARMFSVMPSFVPPIEPGGRVVLSVFYSPTEPSDPADTFSPNRAAEAVLNITSNDTEPGSDVLRAIALRGFARSGVQDQILKVEMEYENADNSWAAADFRDVNLIVESTDGAVRCKKPEFRDLNGNGQFGEGGVPGEVLDHCSEWSAAGTYGRASWSYDGTYEEPERVVVLGLGPEGANGKTFDIKVTYIEDCESVLSDQLGGIIGIAGSILLGALGGSIGVPIAVDPGTISGLLDDACVNREGSTTTTRISLDGQVVASPTVRLNAKGDTRSVARLRRELGAFCSLTPGVGDASLQCQ